MLPQLLSLLRRQAVGEYLAVGPVDGAPLVDDRADLLKGWRAERSTTAERMALPKWRQVRQWAQPYLTTFQRLA